MNLDSSRETVAILYDIENAPFEMLDFTLGKARRYQPCRTIVVSDWNARPEQKRWDRLMRRPGFTFRQIDRTFDGKNSLDYALFDSAKLLYAEGVRRFFIITTDSDFVKIAEALNTGDSPAYIIGVGTQQASETLRSAYDEFLCYSTEGKNGGKEKKPRDDGGEAVKKEKQGNGRNEKPEKNALPKEETAKVVTRRSAKTLRKDDVKSAESKTTIKGRSKVAAEKTVPDKMPAEPEPLSVRLPRTLQLELRQRQQQEGVSMDELITYLLMRGLSR